LLVSRLEIVVQEVAGQCVEVDRVRLAAHL
jgi:hypothetical protein